MWFATRNETTAAEAMAVTKTEETLDCASFQAKWYSIDWLRFNSMIKLKISTCFICLSYKSSKETFCHFYDFEHKLLDCRSPTLFELNDFNHVSKSYANSISQRLTNLYDAYIYRPWKKICKKRNNVMRINIVFYALTSMSPGIVCEPTYESFFSLFS